MDVRSDRLILPALPEPGSAISAKRVSQIERDLISQCQLINDIGLAEEWRRKARAIEMYLREPALQKPMLGAQRHIEARIGQLLGPAVIGANQHGFGHDRTLANSLIDKDDRELFRLLAYALSGEAHQDTKLKCELAPDEWRKSRRALVSLVRQRLGLMPETPALPTGKFACMVADPAWQQDTGPDTFGGTGESGHDHLAYEQMSVENIAALKDRNGRFVGDCAADDAHLYLWTINKYVEAAYDIARAWGFKPSVLLTWCKKPHGVGLGDTFRLTTEFVLFCRRGHLEHCRIIPTTWFDWPRGRHSAKPDEFYQMVESVSAGPRLDLFARRQRRDWTVWGDEVWQDTVKT
jgi:N6-adenosine-specific RNA methylase IME4